VDLVALERPEQPLDSRSAGEGEQFLGYDRRRAVPCADLTGQTLERSGDTGAVVSGEASAHQVIGSEALRGVTPEGEQDPGSGEIVARFLECSLDRSRTGLREADMQKHLGSGFRHESSI
jgi:hypothetical protein